MLVLTPACLFSTLFVVLVPVEECQVSSATSYFWYRVALDISPSIEEPGSLVWRMSVALVVAWLVVFVGMFKGIKSSGKVSMFKSILCFFFLQCVAKNTLANLKPNTENCFVVWRVGTVCTSNSSVFYFWLRLQLPQCTIRVLNNCTPQVLLFTRLRFSVSPCGTL